MTKPLSQNAVSVWDTCFASRIAGMKASEIRELLKLLDQPDIISFAGGIPDASLFPAPIIAEAYQEALTEAPAQALQYSVSEGYRPLRQFIVGLMAQQGVICDEHNIIITHGSQQGLDFLGKLLLSPKDTALVTAPTYLGALQAFNAYEPNYDTLNPSGGNMTPAEYRMRAQQAGGAVKFAYIVPDFSNPTGVTLPLAARQAVLSLAEELNIPIIEDAAYAQLRFDGTPVPSLLKLDIERCGSIEKARTIYCGTFSKTLVPALRIGWICAARPLIQKLVLTKQASDLHTATINQIVAYKAASKVWQNHIPKVAARYRERRDAMLRALEHGMPEGVTWTAPEGGMFIWVTLPEEMDATTLLDRAVKEARVAFVPGKAFFADGTGRNTMRLSFSARSPQEIDEGIKKLARLIKYRVA